MLFLSNFFEGSVSRDTIAFFVAKAQEIIPNAFDNGIAAGVIMVLAFLLIYTLKNNKDREDKLMKFVMDVGPILKSLQKTATENEKNLQNISDKIPPRQSWN